MSGNVDKHEILGDISQETIIPKDRQEKTCRIRTFPVQKPKSNLEDFSGLKSLTQFGEPSFEVKQKSPFAQSIKGTPAYPSNFKSQNYIGPEMVFYNLLLPNSAVFRHALNIRISQALFHENSRKLYGPVPGLRAGQSFASSLSLQAFSENNIFPNKKIFYLI